MKKLILLFLTIPLYVLNLHAQKKDDVEKVVDEYKHVFEWVITPKYGYLSHVPKSKILTASNENGYGYITVEEEIIVPTEWGYASPAYNCGIGVVGKSDSNWKSLLDLKNSGKKINEEKLLYVGHFHGDYAKVGTKGNTKWGIINSKAEFVIPYTFGQIFMPDNIDDILEGRSNDPIPAMLFKNSGLGLYGYADAKGKWVMKPTYVNTYPKSGNFFLIEHMFYKQGLLDEGFNEIIPPDYGQLFIIDETNILAKQNKGKWGLLNKSGEETLAFKYDLISDFDKDGKAYFEKGKEYGYIYLKDKKTELIGTHNRQPIKFLFGEVTDNKYMSFSYEDFDKSKVFGICRFENNKMTILKQPKFASINIIHIGDNTFFIVSITKGSKSFYGILNQGMEYIIDPEKREFNFIGKNSNGYHTVSVKGKYGIAKLKL